MTINEKYQQTVKVITAIRRKMSRGYMSRLSSRLGYSRQNLYKHLSLEKAENANLAELTRINEELEKLIAEDNNAASKIIETLK